MHVCTSVCVCACMRVRARACIYVNAASVCTSVTAVRVGLEKKVRQRKHVSASTIAGVDLAGGAAGDRRLLCESGETEWCAHKGGLKHGLVVSLHAYAGQRSCVWISPIAHRTIHTANAVQHTKRCTARRAIHWHTLHH